MPWGCARPRRAARSLARRVGAARGATGRTRGSCAPGRAAPRRAPPAAPQGCRARGRARPAVSVVRRGPVSLEHELGLLRAWHARHTRSRCMAGV
eukprot:scaffold121796_cov54-Phaeocystis_antarctica.AAC.1